ncbi:MAG: FtsX-like permease family protein [Steroidobacteraceae bacterium]
MGRYFLILLRNFRREKLYTAINIAGLALGLASCLILGLFLKSELTYDRHYKGYENIYRIENEFTTAGKTEKLAITSEALGPMLAAEYPNLIKASLRMRDNTQTGGIAMRRVDQPETVFYWANSYFVDDNVFDVLPIKVLAGDPKTALKEGDTIAISETVAKKYFGSEDPMGKTLMSDFGTVNRISLVFADLPANTHVKHDLLMGYNRATLRLNDNPTARRAQLTGPGARTFTYLVMHPSFKPAEWQRMSDDFYKKYFADMLKTRSIEWRSWLQPMRDVHLYSEVSYDRPTGNPAYLFGCAAVALIILVIACINYMNLATARATRRARSVGFRKILGASRVSLAMQFMGEALLFSLVALAVAVVIVQAVLKFTPINTLMDGKVVMDLMQEPQLALGLVVAAVGIGLLSGLYPAFYLSSWAPLTALSGKQPAAKGSLHVREFLVLVQFTISAAAIACTLLMVAQMRYVSNRPLGFESKNRLMVSLRGSTTIDKIPSIRNALLADSSIKGVAVAAQTPADGNNANINIVPLENKDGVMEGQILNTLSIGEDYEKVLGLKVTQGRDLSSRLLTDVGSNLLVNEALVKKMGWAEPLGKRVRDGRVVGVIGDFNFKSLKYRVEPLVILRLSNDMSGQSELNKVFAQRHLILDVTGADISKTLASVERVMTEADPRHPFEFRFLDEALKAQYKSELSLTKLIGIFAGVSIFIACMGLFGLAAFTTEQRSREIGTRKVLGATAWQIVGLLARRILVLVLVAAVLASVASYFAIDEWLAGFAYRAGINPLIFVFAALAAGAVAFAMVAAQSWRTANADPVHSLRQV